MSDLVKLARERVSNDGQTHWVGCERDHRECLIQRMADEIERLTASLKRANETAEHFERHWYLRGDEIERLRAERDDLRRQLAEAEQDARRLGFMEARGLGCDKISGLGYFVWANGVQYRGDTARAAIDAAMGASNA